MMSASIVAGYLSLSERALEDMYNYIFEFLDNDGDQWIWLRESFLCCTLCGLIH